MTKTLLKKKTKELKDHYSIQQYLTKEDAVWLIKNVLRFHPQWEWYVNKKPKRIFVDKADYGTVCFYIEFQDQTKSSISYQKCIANRPKKVDF